MKLMLAFAERTGLSSDRPQQRYLWTDAFAVCNFLELARDAGDARCAELALRLVDRVHHVLGRHRPDDRRTGWLSGLADREGESHPTLGGLRIGKKLPERAAGEPFDEQLEWDRDGQYFHYLTKWMHALDQVSRSSGQPHFNRWARELASTAHAAFVHRVPGRGLRMIWKASIDLSRPLVASMGQHDPLDGLVTCAQLQATASRLPGAPDEPSLRGACADFEAMLDERALVTADPLGLGALLVDASRVAQLASRGAFVGPRGLFETLLEAAHTGLRHYLQQGALHQPAARRLAFRELGLAIGLHAIALAPELPGAQSALKALRAYAPLASALESYWLAPGHQSTDAWREHRDINEVMLAASLVPRGSVVIG